MGRWAAALADAAHGARPAQIVWVGDSLSELAMGSPPLAWQVGDLLAGRGEPVQYRNAGADLYTLHMDTEGRPLDAREAGLGGRGVELSPGQTTTFEAAGEGLSVLWIRRPGGGDVRVRWGDEVLGTIPTDGPQVGTGLTTLARPATRNPAEIELTSLHASVHLAGIYVHHHNLRSGVRVWPAVRAGNTSRWFSEHRGWLIEPLAALHPDLVVLATGTNDDDYEEEMTGLVHTARRHAPGADLALWLPPLNSRFTAARAAIGRDIARRERCGLIDAAGDLGALPTTDGVHPTAFTVALSSAHASTALGGSMAGGMWSALAEVSRARDARHRWGVEGGGSIEIESVHGLPLLLGKAAEGDTGASWVLAPPPIPQVVAGIEGPAFGMGPGGTENPDTFLSRAAPGRFAVNDGRGSVELERLVLRVDGDEDDARAGVSLGARRGHDRGIEIEASGPDGSRIPLGAPTLEVPLPCVLSAHLHPTVPIEPVPDRAVWVPMPPVSRRVLVTRIWIEVLQPATVRASAGIAGRGAPGLPGELLGRTTEGAIDCAAVGMAGAELLEAVLIEPGSSWWVGVRIEHGAAAPTIAGATSVRCAGVQMAPPGAPPFPGPVTGAVVAAAGDDFASVSPSEGVSLLGPPPAVHVSLEAPTTPRVG